jgi:hypothetical protein
MFKALVCLTPRSKLVRDYFPDVAAGELTAPPVVEISAWVVSFALFTLLTAYLATLHAL